MHDASTRVMTVPTKYDIFGHELAVTKLREGCWTVSVDGRALPASFETQARAWEAGVRELHATGALSVR